MGINLSSIATSRTRRPKMPLWVSIENVASGLYVAISSRANGAQLHLENEVPGKEEQLWDYEEALQKGIFRNKTGLVADLKGSVGPELIAWSHHGGPNQRFTIKDEMFIHTQVNDTVWDVETGKAHHHHHHHHHHNHHQLAGIQPNFYFCGSMPPLPSS